MSARHGEATGRSAAVGRRIGMLALLGSLGAASMAGCSSSPTARQGARVTHPTLSGFDGALPLTGGPQLSCGQATQQAQRQLAFPPTARMTVGETTTVNVELAASGV